MADRRKNESIRTVLFDVGGTLLRPAPSVGRVYSETALRHGHEVDAAWLEDRFRHAWDRSVRRSRDRGYRCSEEILRDEWLQIVGDTFGRSVPPSGLDVLFEDLYLRFVSASAWRVVEGAVESLELLRCLGVRLGVLSNWDRRLPQTLAQVGLARFFDFIVASHDVGFEKPHPRIFEEAIRRCEGEAPSRILHVGDSWDADIIPAVSAGMRVLWITSADPSETRALGGSVVLAEDLACLSADRWRALIQGAV